MAIDGTKIIAPISASDPYQVTGTAQRSSGWDIGYICSNEHQNTNPWSKYKPVPYPSITARHDTNYTLYRGVDGKCGIDAAIYTGLQLIGGMIDTDVTVPKTPFTTVVKEQHATAVAKCQVLQGGTSEPFRLTDWIGYDHDATSVFLYKFPYNPNVAGTYSQQIAIGYKGKYSDVESGVAPGVSSTLALIDIMHSTLHGGNQTLVVYNTDGSINTDIQNDIGYGIQGIICLVGYTDDDQVPKGVFLKTRNFGAETGDDLQTIILDFDVMTDGEGGDNSLTPNQYAMVVPCVCNINTNDEWYQLRLGDIASDPTLARYLLFPPDMNGGKWYGEYYMRKIPSVVSTATIATYPTAYLISGFTAPIIGCNTNYPNMVGGSSLSFSGNLPSSIDYRIYADTWENPNMLIGEGTFNPQNSTISILSWNTYSTTDLFYTGMTNLRDSAANNTQQQFVQEYLNQYMGGGLVRMLSITTPYLLVLGTDDRTFSTWTEPIYNWNNARILFRVDNTINPYS